MGLERQHRGSASLLQLERGQREQRQEAEVLWLERVTEQDIAQYLGAADPLLPRRLHHLADGIPALVESLSADELSFVIGHEMGTSSAVTASTANSETFWFNIGMLSPLCCQFRELGFSGFRY